MAVCNAVVDLGLQPGFGQYPDPKPQVWIRWEIPSERVQYEKDGKKIDAPQVIGNIYTASMHKKARLRIALESWRGRAFTDEEAAAFDVSSVLGASCMLGVVENIKGDKVYSNVGSILQLPRGIAKLTAENKLLYYDPENREQFSSLPEWIRTKIENPAKIQASHATGNYANEDAGNYYSSDDAPPHTDNDFGSQGITDDDIPF